VERQWHNQTRHAYSAVLLSNPVTLTF